MNFIPIDMDLGLSIGKRPIYSVSEWGGYAIFSTTVGDTECCGSGEFWVPFKLDVPLVHFLLKKASVAIMHIHCKERIYWEPPVNITDVFNNSCVKGVFNITGKKLNDGVLLFLEILDIDAYRTWKGV